MAEWTSHNHTCGLRGKASLIAAVETSDPIELLTPEEETIRREASGLLTHQMVQLRPPNLWLKGVSSNTLIS